MADLPTVEECREFLRVINEGRALIDLPPLDVLDFDDSYPGSATECLSASSLFSHAGYLTRAAKIEPGPGDRDRRVLAILDYGKIPGEILAVTDAFDAAEFPGSDEWHALRARMVEAGVVAP